MFALPLTVPFVIFVLPALLKKLGCSLNPRELREEALSCALPFDGIKQIKRDAEEDKQLEETPDPRTSERDINQRKRVDDLENDGQDVIVSELAAAQDATVIPEEANTLEDHEAVANAPYANGLAKPPPSSEVPSHEIRRSRRASSKVAALRAAFEEAGTVPNNARRVSSNGRSIVGENEYDLEMLRLSSELKKERDLRVAYEERVTDLEEEIEDLTAQLEDQDEVRLQDYQQGYLADEGDAEEQLATATSEATSQTLLLSALQRQLNDLKRSVLISARPNTADSDNAFRKELCLLQHEVQQWVANNFWDVEADAVPNEIYDRLQNLGQSKQAERLRQISRGFQTASRLLYYEAAVASYLLEIFDDQYLFGLSTELEWVDRLRKTAESLSFVLPPAAYHRWRAVTFDALRHSEIVKEVIEIAADGVAESIHSTLITTTNAEPDATNCADLKPIIRRAIDLAHRMRVQQVQYEVCLPIPGELFDSTSMEDISEASDAEAERAIRCATFISVAKISNDTGDYFVSPDIISKARVICNDPAP